MRKIAKMIANITYFIVKPSTNQDLLYPFAGISGQVEFQKIKVKAQLVCSALSAFSEWALNMPLDPLISPLLAVEGA